MRNEEALQSFLISSPRRNFDEGMRNEERDAKNSFLIPHSSFLRRGGTMVIDRYTTPEMAVIWAAQAKVEAWLQVELAVCDAWAERGAIPAEALPELHKASINLDRMQVLEAETDHDVIAFLRAV